ncbi:putative methyltransferase-domain-containing protein [Coniochaeta sp. 2T2.1]|nr:putative methyltransferase-domain-containing protein [Coniochaeta sp. 2T2.1]
MHYIRLLRPPSLDVYKTGRSLKLVISITTDLGDSFLAPSTAIPIRVLIRSHGPEGSEIWTEITPVRSRPTWRSGLRVLKLDLPVPAALSGIDKLHIRPADAQIVAGSAVNLAGRERGLIVPVSVDLVPASDDAAHVCYRVLKLSSHPGAGLESALQVEEEIGDTSLARHVWDGGLMTLAHIANMRSPVQPAGFTSGMVQLKEILSQDNRELNILEIGCGIGTLGIGLAQIFRSVVGGRAERVSILMTDLPEAEERVRANIARYEASATEEADRSDVSIDYENLDWEDGRVGKFGTKVRSRLWDLVVLSDCTYNVDTIPALVQTLSQVHAAARRHPDCPSSGWRSKVMIGTKPRHWSEEIFVAQMEGDDWAVDETERLPLPMLDGERQAVEIYLFGKAGQ